MKVEEITAGWYRYTDLIPNLLLALLVLLIGYFVAKGIGKAVEGALKKTSLDNRLFSNVDNRKYPSEVIIGKIVFYILFVFVWIIFFNMLNLSLIATPLVSMVSTLTSAIPNLLKATLILLFAWIIAYLVRLFIEKGAKLGHITSRLVNWKMAKSEQDAASKVNGLAKAIFYFILLLFLPGVLAALQMEGISQPFSNMLSTILAFLPKLFASALIVLIGWLAAKFVRDLLTNFLSSIGTDRIGHRMGLLKSPSGINLSSIIGNIAFIFILIPTVITALEKLDLKGISEPAIAMLHDILTMIPNVLVAVIFILIGVWLGKWVEKMVVQMLWRLKFDQVFHQIGIGALTPQQSKNSLSQLAGLLAKIVVVLLFTAEALQIVHLDFLVTIASGVIAYLPMLLTAVLIIGIGLYVGHLVERILQNLLKLKFSRTLAAIAKYSIFAMTLFMALDQLGVAHSIVNAAFILILGSLALAFGLAFGLGGKSFAAKYLGKLDKKLEEKPEEL
ncbi:mechanosensitive ion channel [Cytobacillus praedii]|uniref:mechanosensitive ion channel n=1 Tax=Cytobacillus praedii TaxID=1742358 RepID=UPI002E2286D8|nr:mechanosensitive ion channel [Cytobacillus praedii]MED3575016.1 mechanosensitive ion channel [Cytobacillus praedii]